MQDRDTTCLTYTYGKIMRMQLYISNFDQQERIEEKDIIPYLEAIREALKPLGVPHITNNIIEIYRREHEIQGWTKLIDLSQIAHFKKKHAYALMSVLWTSTQETLSAEFILTDVNKDTFFCSSPLGVQIIRSILYVKPLK